MSEKFFSSTHIDFRSTLYPWLAILTVDAQSSPRSIMVGQKRPQGILFHGHHGLQSSYPPKLFHATYILAVVLVFEYRDPMKIVSLESLYHVSTVRTRIEGGGCLDRIHLT